MITQAHIEQQLVLTFELPGVEWKDCTHGAAQKQLENRLGEKWTLKVTPENVQTTIECLRAVIVELERFSERSR